MPIKITDVLLKRINSPENTDLAYIATIIIDGELIINDIRVYEISKGRYKINLPNHPIASSHGVKNISTTSSAGFYKIKHAIIKEIEKRKLQLG